MNKNQTEKTRQIALKTPIGFIAFGFGSGLAPFAPGTFGSLAALPFYLLLVQFHWPMYAFLVLMAFFVGVKLCGITSARLGVHDHGGIVWDEFVGLWITLFLVPFTWYWVLTGFILFRFFDIIKPFPIKWLDQKVDGGFGIMIDDVLAGVYAWIVLQLLIKLV
ncbi:MAG: phosphatidylglycerophosphatase A [Proteobacteria bacterium]|nr:phosphatidylglycerophosphatase A [Pseudomonadota bacterium]